MDNFHARHMCIIPMDIFHTMSFCFLLLILDRWKLCKIMVKSWIHVIFVLILLVPLFRPSVFRVVFFSIFQFIRDTTLFSVTIFKQTHKRKNNFQDQISFYFDVNNRHYFIKVITATNFNFIPWMKLKILKGGCKLPSTCMHTILQKHCTLKRLIK